MNNNNYNDIVFGKKWFEKHQSKLLWLLNTPIIKYWFRWVLNIPERGNINRITPSSISYNVEIIEDKLQVTTDFSSCDKYSQILYFSFKPFWYILHFLDWVMLDRIKYASSLSFGFSTLAVKTNSIGTDNPVEGYTQYIGTTWAVARAAASGDFAYMNNFVYMETDKNSSSAWLICRGYSCFDTSPLTNDATISSAIMSCWAQTKSNADAGHSDVFLVASTQNATNALVFGDYSKVGDTSFGTLSYADISTTAYVDMTINAGGISNISKTGISKFAFRLGGDFNNTAPTAENRVRFYGYRNDTTKAIILTVTYTVPIGPANLKTYNTNAKANIKTINTNPIANVKSLNTNV